MGSPLGPVLANIFMCHLEDILFRDCSPAFRPLFYRRYVDDTFLLFRSEDAAEQFLEYANGIHNNIQFTIEHENNDCLSFLDIMITRCNEHFSTSVFRKKTYTGLGSNFYSSCFLTFKTNSICTLLHRAFDLSSSWLDIHKEVEFLRTYFNENCYPSFLFDRFLKRFLKDKFQPVIPTTTVPKLGLYASLPYTKDAKFLSTLNDIIRKYFYCVDPKLVLGT